MMNYLHYNTFQKLFLLIEFARFSTNFLSALKIFNEHYELLDPVGCKNFNNLCHKSNSTMLRRMQPLFQNQTLSSSIIISEEQNYKTELD